MTGLAITGAPKLLECTAGRPCSVSPQRRPLGAITSSCRFMHGHRHRLSCFACQDRWRCTTDQKFDRISGQAAEPQRRLTAQQGVTFQFHVIPPRNETACRQPCKAANCKARKSIMLYRNVLNILSRTIIAPRWSMEGLRTGCGDIVRNKAARSRQNLASQFSDRPEALKDTPSACDRM